MTANSEQLFLRHFIGLIKERMAELPPMSKASTEFEAGVSLAYHEVSGFILECSQLFNIPLKSIDGEGIDPDMLL